MPSLIGIWIYASLIYNGVPVPRPNPDLTMYLVFQNFSENELYYYDRTAGTNCRRTAAYKVDKEVLYQKIIQVDPSNTDSCASDTDMQMSRESFTDVKVDGNNLYMQIPLGDESITYVWKRITNPSDFLSQMQLHVMDNLSGKTL